MGHCGTEDRGSSKEHYLCADRFPLSVLLITYMRTVQSQHRSFHYSFVSRSAHCALYCGLTFILVQALMQPMSMDSDADEIFWDAQMQPISLMQPMSMSSDDMQIYRNVLMQPMDMDPDADETFSDVLTQPISVGSDVDESYSDALMPPISMVDDDVQIHRNALKHSILMDSVAAEIYSDALMPPISMDSDMDGTREDDLIPPFFIDSELDGFCTGNWDSDLPPLVLNDDSSDEDSDVERVEIDVDHVPSNSESTDVWIQQSMSEGINSDADALVPVAMPVTVTVDSDVNGINSDADTAMSVDSDVERVGIGADHVPTNPESTVDWVYGNARGLRQGSGDFRKAVVTRRPTFFAVNETHLDGDPIKQLIPWGYKVLCRLDRSKHGGGLVIGCKKQVLADPLKLDNYNESGVAELIGIDWGGKHWILYYTPHSKHASRLLQVLQQYKEDHPQQPTVFIGDMNVHNQDWICSTFTDKAGIQAQEFCEMFGMSQLVNFPTRGENTLDLVISDFDGRAIAESGFGSSDHLSLYLTFDTTQKIPTTPIRKSVRDWQNAPWNHMKGALKRALANWKPSGGVDEAEADLDNLLSKVVDDYVKWKKPTRPGPTPWWNCKCEKAYKWKRKCFVNRVTDQSKYDSAVKFNRKIQKKAYGSYQKKIKKKLASMSSGDSNFWQLAKEIGGLERTRSESAPSAQKLAEHFAEKMSNGKDDTPDTYIPKNGLKVPLLGFKIRYKNVLKALQNVDPSKSANGIAPIFWKECAKIIAPSVYTLFQHIVKHKKCVTR